MKQVIPKTNPKSYSAAFLRGTFPYQLAPRYKRARLILFIIWTVIFYVHRNVSLPVFLAALAGFFVTNVALDYLFFWRATQKR